MSEMIDRVARAIFASWRKQMDEDGQTGKGPLSFDDLDGDERGFGIDAARAAISAMRDPTEKMSDAGLIKTTPYPEDVYRAMIDESLK